MKKKKFTIIEMIVIIVVISILISMSFPYIREAQLKSKKTTTRNQLNQLKGMVSAYFTDYRSLPLSNHINPTSYFDSSAPTKYWDRIPKGLYTVNSPKAAGVDGTLNKNLELYFDIYNDDGASKNSAEFETNFPSKNIIANLDSWYTGSVIEAKEHQEEINVISHSSRFLNYYLSLSGFDANKDTPYIQSDDFHLGDNSTNFRLSWDRSAMIRPFLYFMTDETVLWTVVGDENFDRPNKDQMSFTKERKQSKIKPITSYIQNKQKIYTNYLLRIYGPYNKQQYSKNIDEEKLRRLYNFHEDKTADGMPKPPPTLVDVYAPKQKLLNSDKILFFEEYLKDASSSYLQNSECGVYMRAHVDNVKSIVDAFNSPIVYITYTNQRKRSAMTYKEDKVDPAKKDLSISSDTFVLYSLGPNKADDSDLAENHFREQATGDDIIESASIK